MSKKLLIPRSEYPRPQFERADWRNLNGKWTYEFDFGKSGLERGLEKSTGFGSTITVPFCPESRLSGVAHTDFIESMFYHRILEIPKAWAGKQIFLNFGAVDFECRGFVDGQPVGKHFGGTSSFSFDLTNFVKAGKKHHFVLYVFDDTRSGVQANGKQCPWYKSCGCDYTRTTGIWQTVWMEAVSCGGLKRCKVLPDLDNHAFHFIPEFYGHATDYRLTTQVFAGKRKIAETTVKAGPFAQFSLDLGKDYKTWSPESPFLYDIVYTVKDSGGNVIDTVKSYAGLRKVHTDGDRFYLNNKPIYLRLVLDQGFYPDGVWTAPSDAALKRDIELSMAAGFNGARLHQKVFEERFHYWADKLGYLTWGESSSWGYQCFTNGNPRDPKVWESQWNFQTEWQEIVNRDLNHPSIIAWTPANETWRYADDVGYERFMTSIYRQTKYLDPTRPVNDTSGYHHILTDLWTVHLYCKDVADLKKNVFPENKPVYIRDKEQDYRGQPYIIDEIGGFKYIPPELKNFADNTWGYHGLDIKSSDELCKKISEQIKFLLSDDRISGYCYTQLTDVEQEQNGVYNFDRSPKMPEKQLYEAFKNGKFVPAAKCKGKKGGC